MNAFITAITIIHVAAGTIALLVGLIPMFSKKGSRLHNRAGLIYVWCMITVATTALFMCGLQPFKMLRLFLTGIAVFSFYLCITGWRATKRKRAAPTMVDKGLTYVTLGVSIAMISFGLYLLTDGLSVFAILFSFFGFLTFRNAWYDFKSFGKTPKKMHWFFHHFIRMGGSYIATFTAFLVNNVYRILPQDASAWIGTMSWILPSFIGGMLIARTVQYYKQRLGDSKALKTTLNER